MALTKYTLGDLLVRNTENNAALQYSEENVRGVLNTKGISNTKVSVEGRDLSKFLVVRPGGFIFNHRVHDKLGLGYNISNDVYIFTNDYVAFYVRPEIKETVLLPDYLYMWFLRSEFDRYMLFKTYGSATLFFNWDNMCELEITLPDVSVQKKYVDIYNAMVANQQSYERGLENLKLACDGYIEDLRRKTPSKPIGEYLELVDSTNSDLRYSLDAVRGISIEKKFIETKANMEGVNLTPYLVIQPGEFGYAPVTSRNGGKISIALNDSDDTYICSSSYVVFKSKNAEDLWPHYLMLFFSRTEFDRYARFNSWGSARETFDWDEMCNVRIPIPEIGVQKAIAEMFTVFIMRKQISEQLKAQIKDICPILIKGSIKEGELV